MVNHKKNNKDCSSPLGFWRISKDYLFAAQAVANSPECGKISEPVYFLLGHSIELGLKAYLRAIGMPVDDLKNKFGHDLDKLLKEARRRKLGRFLKFYEKEVNYIKVLNDYYKSKNFEYYRYGFRRLPKYDVLYGMASRLVKELEQYCHEKNV